MIKIDGDSRYIVIVLTLISKALIDVARETITGDGLVAAADGRCGRMVFVCVCGGGEGLGCVLLAQWRRGNIGGQRGTERNRREQKGTERNRRNRIEEKGTEGSIRSHLGRPRNTAFFVSFLFLSAP